MPHIDHDNVRFWFETEFREAIEDDCRVMAAAAVMSVSHAEGDPAVDSLRYAIIDFVRTLVDPVATAADLFRGSMSRAQASETSPGFDPISLGC